MKPVYIAFLLLQASFNMFGSQEMTPEQQNSDQNTVCHQLLREISNENMDSVSANTDTGSKSVPQGLLISPPGSPLRLCNVEDPSEGSPLIEVPRKPILTILSKSDQNNNALPVSNSAALPKITKVPKSVAPPKPKDAQTRKKSRGEEDFDKIHDGWSSFPKGLVKVDPDFHIDKLLHNACNGKCREVGEEKAEKKAKALEDHLFNK